MTNPDTALVIPMDIAALCIGDTDVNGSSTNPYGSKDFSRLAADFSLLPYAQEGSAHNKGPYISYQVLADTFQKASNPLEVGIHLHWALPDAIAHGSQATKNSHITFPEAPNRWLVVRIASNVTNSSKPVSALNAWVVESDRLWDLDKTNPPSLPQNNKSLSVPLPPDPTAANNKSTATMGKVFNMDTWAEENNAQRIPLNALGYGEPSYAAAYEFCPNVFGFWDTLQDLDPAKFPPANTRVSYMLSGWYSDPSTDPLNTIEYPVNATVAEKLSTINQVYRWTFDIPDPAQTFPDHTLYNALITDIPWDKTTHYLHPKKPDSGLEIAIGNTSSEALSALIAAQPQFASLKNVESLLNALQIGVLNRLNLPSGLADIDEALHQAQFASLSHGLIWEVKPKPDDSNNNDPLTPEGQLKSSAHDLAQLPASVADQLNQLNSAQQAVDQAELNISSLRQRIFSDWVRTMRLTYSSLPPLSTAISANDARNFVEDEVDVLNKLLTQLTTFNTTVEQEKNTLEALLTADFVVGSSSSARFWNPVDPVILFSGSEVEPPLRYKPVEGKDADGNLICRLSSQLVTTLSVTTPNLTISADKLPSINFSNSYVYATELQGLVGEAFFLDPQQADVLTHAIAQLGGEDNPAVTDPSAFTTHVITAQNALFSDSENLTPPSVHSSDYQIQFTGQAPTLVSFKKWAPPWIPIIMQWETIHYPNTLPAYPADFITDHYALDADEIDLRFKHAIPVDKSFARTYQGTIILGHNTEINIKNQINQYLKNFPDDDHDGELQKIYDQLDLSMQAQAMSGFNQAFLMLDRVLQMQVSDPLGILQGIYFSNFTNQVVNQAVAHDNTDSPLSNNTFGSIRSGGMTINRLRIIDAFGQALDIEQPDIIRAETFTAPDDSGLISLPVRYTQASRLLFRWLSAKDDQIEVNAHPASTPVCGWILFNHLDDSLVIYNQAGLALGSFNILGPFWSGAPGNQETFNQPIEQVFSNANPHLKNFALGINAAPDPKAYLQDILQVIDDSITFISPQNYQQQQGLSVLIGRPLALVRASLNLDVSGMPAMNQSKQSFANAINAGTPLQRDEGATPQVKMPVQLGDLSDIDDGLIGYFIDTGKSDVYQRFYAPAAVENPPQNHGVYHPAFDQLIVESDPQASSLLVSILMDPHASIHATTGMLPIKELVIPPSIIADDLNAMAITFLTTPVISGNDLSIPIPDESGYSWSWVSLDHEAQQWTVSDLSTIGTEGPLTMTPQKAHEGWLKLQHDVNKKTNPED